MIHFFGIMATHVSTVFRSWLWDYGTQNFPSVSFPFLSICIHTLCIVQSKIFGIGKLSKILFWVPRHHTMLLHVGVIIIITKNDDEDGGFSCERLLLTRIDFRFLFLREKEEREKSHKYRLLILPLTVVRSMKQCKNINYRNR
jgi:hypothetical protein